MSHVGNVMKMLIILKSRGKIKIKELAEVLEVDERTIRRYKDDLEQARVYISSSCGRDGGYYLENDDYLLGLNITDEEYNSLLIAQKQLSDMGNPFSKDYDFFMEKINLLTNKSSELYAMNNYMVKNAMSTANQREERKRLIDFHAAIFTKNKIRIKYVSLKSGLTERIVHTYAIYQYKCEMYFVGFCELRNSIIDFKLSRIKEYQVLSERFVMDEHFEIKGFMKNCIGIYKGSEYIVKLKIQFPMSQIVREKVWVEEQKIADLKDGSILYEARMQGIEEIKSWILGMGSSVLVLEPEELKDQIKNEIKKMKNLY